MKRAQSNPNDGRPLTHQEKEILKDMARMLADHLLESLNQSSEGESTDAKRAFARGTDDHAPQ